MGSFRRTSFGLKLAVRPEIDQVFASRLVGQVRANGFQLDLGHLLLRLPRSFGLCHGVERAIELAHETRRRHPGARLFLTDEIVHNAAVNARLREMGYRYLGGRYADGITLAELGPADVVVLPAFGVETTELERLRAQGVQLVDTTCGEVMSVWKRVRAYASDGFTTVIHGTPNHQETRATVSRAAQDDPFFDHRLAAPGAWIVVRGLEDAHALAAVIAGDAAPATLAARFAGGACSPGFDPARDLARLGIANQTTMLARETLAVQEVLRRAFVARHGEAGAAARLRQADTVCSATQDRQDALRELLRDPPGLLLVVGGYNSANTGHLAELGRARGVPVHHIEGAECLSSRQRLRAWHAPSQRERIVEGWWPAGNPATIAVAAGASTPDARIGELLRRLAALGGCSEQRLLALADGVPQALALH